jgi:hypothetical protein
LLTNTDQSQLTEAERTRDANTLRELGHQKIMLARSNEVVSVVKKHKPGLLKEPIDIESESV